jgi:uncharacterized protein (DUF924 family)
MADTAINYEAVIAFWFDELTPEQWFKKSDRLDAIIKERFAGALQEAAAGEYWTWRKNAKGRLAEIILLDQFSRNLYRDTAQAFAQDPMALVLAQEAVALGLDKGLSSDEKAFLYMPYMHSESTRIHEQAEVLFNQPGLEHNYEFELKHKVIIDRFGRYPHRNQILGRESSEAEIEFLRQPGSSF